MPPRVPRYPDGCDARRWRAWLPGGDLRLVRTLIRGGWVVGFDVEARSHRLFRNGAVVYENDRILHAGPPFQGEADRTVDAGGMLVMPGLINTHLHLGTN